jgi:DNA (cytosine-5)-methyltransferase 1
MFPSQPQSSDVAGRVGKRIAHTLTTGMQLYTPTHDKRLRRLTPLECERLQGFPDGWTKEGADSKERITTISETQRYKCLGNAVSVPVIDAIAQKLLGDNKGIITA